MKRNQMIRWASGLFGIAPLLGVGAAARGQAWISYVEDPSRISADTSVINDFPCNPECTESCVASVRCEETEFCACACEKDIAVGDLNGDGKDDVVIVRIQPFMTAGGVSNLLFLNENEVMVDRTDFAEGFADPTQDRDVVIADVDFDPNSELNADDVVVASTFGEQPRVYINLGCCGTACSPSTPCATENKVSCNTPGRSWCGLKYDPGENRIPAFSPAPSFCAVGAGDVDNDGCRDLYFTDYDNALEDRLLLNAKDGDRCTGFFTDATETPSTRLCPNGPPCFNQSGFGTGAQIVDINKDGFNDIVKNDADPNADGNTIDGEVIILYNDAGNPGHFNVRHSLTVEFPGSSGLSRSYMFVAGDMNVDRGVDLYVVRTARDRFVVNECLDPNETPVECNRPAPNEDTVQFIAPEEVQNTTRTHYPGGNVGFIDMDGDTYLDVLLTDVDVPGNFCTNTMRILRTTVDFWGLDVNVTEPIGEPSTVNDSNCAWNTNMTYDFAVLDINGDLIPDLWSGHAHGNQFFLGETPSDCDDDFVPDRCDTKGGPTPGGENIEGACCFLDTGQCVDLFKPCCEEQGGAWQGGIVPFGTPSPFTCEEVIKCPEQQ